MSDAFETRLGAAYRDIYLNRPLDDIVLRGRRIRRWRRARWCAATLTVAGAASLVIGVVVPGSHTSAFAGWRVHPSVLPAAQAAGVVKSCESVLVDTGLPARLVEGRGPFAYVVFTDGKRAADCLMLDENGRFRQGGASGPQPVRQRTVVIRDGQAIAVEQAGALTVDVTEHAASVWGWVGPQVATVRVFSEGTEIDALVTHGLFSAWWPMPSDPAKPPPLKVVAYDSTNREVGSVTQPGPGGPLNPR